MLKYMTRYCLRKILQDFCFYSWNCFFLRFGYFKFHTNAFYLHSNENPTDSLNLISSEK
jgi:hypothetical protein